MKSASGIWREDVCTTFKYEQAASTGCPHSQQSDQMLPRIGAYLSDFAVIENAVPLRRQKSQIDGWVSERRIAGPICYLIDSGRRCHPAVYGHTLCRLIGGDWQLDIMVVESISRFADDPEMALRAAVMLTQNGIKVCEVERKSRLQLGSFRSGGQRVSPPTCVRNTLGRPPSHLRNEVRQIRAEEQAMSLGRW